MPHTQMSSLPQLTSDLLCEPPEEFIPLPFPFFTATVTDSSCLIVLTQLTYRGLLWAGETPTQRAELFNGNDASSKSHHSVLHIDTFLWQHAKKHQATIMTSICKTMYVNCNHLKRECVASLTWQTER